MKTRAWMPVALCLLAWACSDMIASRQTVASNGTETIAFGTVSLGTSEIRSDSCAPVVSSFNANIQDTDALHADWATNPSQLQGYGVSPNGEVLTVYPYLENGFVRFVVCNSTGSSISPDPVKLTWRVTR